MVDIGTIVGLVFGSLLVVAAILIGGDALIFFNVPSILIVGGGTFAAVLIRFPAGEVKNTLKVLRHAFGGKTRPAGHLIAQFVELSQISRKEGLLALENLELDDNFMKKGVAYCVDGADPESIEALMLKEVQYSMWRHKVGIKLFRAMGDAAPAFGMIGTLIGLVQMLTAMDDPSQIGPAMAVALLTTLYGSLVANLVCIPIAEKLEHRNAEEYSQKMMIVEGVLGLRKGESPHMLREALDSFVAPKDRDDKALDTAAA